MRKLLWVLLLSAGAGVGCASELEGDDVGECSDGADNDADGLFDCDDSDCFGSSDCDVTSNTTSSTTSTTGTTTTGTTTTGTTTTGTTTTTNTTPDSPAEIRTEDQVREWATLGSAPSVVMFAVLPYINAMISGDKVCPVYVEDDYGTTITGGCTDIAGTEWAGELVISATGFAYDEFSSTTYSEDGKTLASVTEHNGIYGFNADGSGTIDLVVDIFGFDELGMPFEDKITFLYDLAPTQEDGSTQTYNGTGEISTQKRGHIYATTVDEVLDDKGCETEAESGTTTLESGDDTVVLTYDGETDCSEDATVQWSLNGEDQGELTGISCSVNGSPVGLLASGLTALCIIVPLRRRTQSK